MVCNEKQLTVHCVADDLANCDTMSVTVNFPCKGMGVLGIENLERLRLGKLPSVIYFVGETTAGPQLQLMY